MLLDVNNLLDELNAKLKSNIDECKKKPVLATIRVGDNPGVISYERSIQNIAKKVGVILDINRYDESISEDKMLEIIKNKNEDKNIDGILLFSPMKGHDINKYFNAIDLDKDVDGQNEKSISNIFLSKDYKNVATTAVATLEYLKSITDLSGKDVLVINRSKIIGIPLSLMLKNENATVTVAHSKTNNLYDKISKSDIIVSAIGKYKILDTDRFKKDAIIIDIGYSLDENGNPSGDFDKEKMNKLDVKYLPSIGGIGKLNSNIILRNTYLNGVKNDK